MSQELTPANTKEGVRARIVEIDKSLIKLLAERSDLVCHIGKIKHQLGENLQDSQVEARKFESIRLQCEELGLDFDYISELWSIIMYSAKVRECAEVDIDSFLSDKEIDAEKLRTDLLELTKVTAPLYHDFYCTGTGSDAISAYRERERLAITRALKRPLPDYDLALDLGCATGQMTELLENQFARVQAFDVSRHMCQEAILRRQNQPWQSHVSFHEHDLELGIPIADESVSFIIANFGVASELGPKLLSEVKRVLKKGGSAVLSFYNNDALLNYWFYPWPSTVKARLNRHNSTLEVWTNGKVYTVHAVGKTVGTLKMEFKAKGLKIAENEKTIESYPTLQAIVPKFFFSAKGADAKQLVTMIGRIDKDMARSTSNVYNGTYILTEVFKE